MPSVSFEGFESFAVDHRPPPRTRYDHALRAFLDDFFAAYPVVATHIGYHFHDHQWPDLSGSARLGQIAMLRRHRDAVAALPEEELSGDERIDREILLETIDATLFDEEVLREPTWDPLSYVYLVGSGLLGLLARNYAPFVHRGAAFLIRMRRLPEVFAAARENLLGLPDRPVSLLHTETALDHLDGIGELIDVAIEDAYRNRAPGEDRSLHRLLEEEAPAAREAIEEFRRFLDGEVRARAKGEGRLGAALFQQKLRHTVSSEMPYADYFARARRDHGVVRAEMVRLARELWSTWIGEEPLPSEPDATDSHAGSPGDGAATASNGDDEIVRRVLDAISREHRQPDELLDYCRRETARIERFVRRNEMIGLPREPLEITWTPAFLRAYGGASLDSPGPLDKGQKSYFWITPPGDDWPPERVESSLRENNDRMLRLLCIHEAIPGHYLQLSWSNRSPSLTRGIFASGMFAEGWAVYITQVMMDVGYGRRDPALMLIHWKFYLRAITNAIIDVLIHTAEMSEEEAMDLMVGGAFQEEQEARAKWLRARLTSTQLSTYYLGSIEFWDLEEAVRRRKAVEVGESADSVPPQRLVGDLGDTPGFDLREHLEACISHGTPPIRYVRRILAG